MSDENPKITVHVVLNNANGQDADVTVEFGLLPGDNIPVKIEEAAALAAREAWDRKVVRLRPVKLDRRGDVIR